jgi:hypothetical protein
MSISPVPAVCGALARVGRLRVVLSALVVTSAVMAAAPIASASPITITFTGTVTDVEGSASLLASVGMASAGGSVTGSYRVDPQAGTIDFGNGVEGRRVTDQRVATVDYRFGGGSAGNVAGEGAVGYIDERCFDPDADVCTPVDQYLLLIKYSPRPGIYEEFAMLLLARGPSSAVDPSLPLSPAPLSQWDVAQFGWSFENGNQTARVLGTVTSLEATDAVAEPASMALLVVGLATGAARRRRHRSRPC